MRKVYLVGTGNVAWHLASAFRQSNTAELAGVWSRNPLNTNDFAMEFNMPALSHPELMAVESGLILLAVPDRAISEIVGLIPPPVHPGLYVAHTSGATPASVFPEGWHHSGVFYPLQTLTKGYPVDFRSVPVLVHSGDESTQKVLSAYAGMISGQVVPLPDEDRVVLHLAAVWMNNFIHHTGVQAIRILREKGLDPALLMPLLDETVHKLHEADPARLQTGPALRGDLPTLAKHLSLMSESPRLAGLYRAISLSINPSLPL